MKALQSQCGRHLSDEKVCCAATCLFQLRAAGEIDLRSAETDMSHLQKAKACEHACAETRQRR